MFVTEPDTKMALAELYRSNFYPYVNASAEQAEPSDQQSRIRSSAVYMADRLHVEPGDRLLAIETEHGVLLTPYDPDTEEALAAAAGLAKRYRNALRALAR